LPGRGVHDRGHQSLQPDAGLGSLDGSRGFRALTTRQRWLIVALLAAALAISRERMLIIVALGIAWSLFRRNAPPVPDWGAFARYASVAVLLTAIAAASVHAPALAR
jgi:hypothetical protein